MEQVERFLILGTSSIATYFFGGWSILLTGLFVLNVFDFILGILGSEERTNSKRFYQGGIKKGIMWMWIGISNLIYLILFYLGYDIGIVIPNYVAIYFILMEIISLEENSEKLGMGIPTPLSFAIEKLKEIFNTKMDGERK